jgi:hypothetical protein
MSQDQMSREEIAKKIALERELEKLQKTNQQ